MTTRTSRALVVLVTLSLMAFGITATEAAATTLTQRSLLAVVNADGSVTGRATVTASTSTVASTFGIWVRGANGNSPGVAYKKNVSIGTTGSSISGTNRYPAGTYTYGVYVVVGGKATTIGSTRTFAVPPPARAILFEDDFNGPAGQSFDRSKWQDWSYCTFRSSAAYGSIACGDSETLDGSGHLRIPATPTSGSSLSTATKFGFVYGEVSAWIKMPEEDGYWPAFWGFNSNPACCEDTAPITGELDVVEQYTTWDDLFHRGAHNWAGDQTWAGPDDNSYGNVDLTAAFHKYTAKVEPGRISFYFDDMLTGTLSKSDGNGKPWAFGPDVSTPNWLILTLAIGGAGGQQGLPTAPATMLVDRVEVRAL